MRWRWGVAVLAATAACGENSAPFDWVVQHPLPDVVSFRDGDTWSVVNGTPNADGTETYHLPDTSDFALFYACSKLGLTVETQATAAIGLISDPCFDTRRQAQTFHVTGTVHEPGTVAIGSAQASSTTAPWEFDLEVPAGEYYLGLLDADRALTMTSGADVDANLALGDLDIPTGGDPVTPTDVLLENVDGADLSGEVQDLLASGIDLSGNPPDTRQRPRFVQPFLADGNNARVPLYFDTHQSALFQLVTVTARTLDGDREELRTSFAQADLAVPDAMPFQDRIGPGVTVSHTALSVDVATAGDHESFTVTYADRTHEQRLITTGDFVARHGLTTFAFDTDIAGYGGDLDPDFATADRSLDVEDRVEVAGNQIMHDLVLDHAGVVSTADVLSPSPSGLPRRPARLRR